MFSIGLKKDPGSGSSNSFWTYKLWIIFIGCNNSSVLNLKNLYHISYEMWITGICNFRIFTMGGLCEPNKKKYRVPLFPGTMQIRSRILNVKQTRNIPLLILRSNPFIPILNNIPLKGTIDVLYWVSAQSAPLKVVLMPACLVH